jgi:hypothetical protein
MFAQDRQEVHVISVMSETYLCRECVPSIHNCDSSRLDSVINRRVRPRLFGRWRTHWIQLTTGASSL